MASINTFLRTLVPVKYQNEKKCNMFELGSDQLINSRHAWLTFQVDVANASVMYVGIITDNTYRIVKHAEHDCRRLDEILDVR